MTDLGRLVSMVSSVLGIAVIALPSGIITSGFIEEFQEDMRRRDEQQDQELVSLREHLSALRKEAERERLEREALESYYSNYEDLR